MPPKVLSKGYQPNESVGGSQRALCRALPHVVLPLSMQSTCLVVEAAGRKSSGRAVRLSVHLWYHLIWNCTLNWAHPVSEGMLGNRRGSEVRQKAGEHPQVKRWRRQMTADWEWMVEGNKVMRLMSTSVLPFLITQK